MTSTHWEKVDRGRYASELHGHILQAIRRDGPYEPDQRPYVAIVDRVPIGDAWNLNLAKTKAIQFVERQHGKAKAERVFKNGAKARPAEPPMIPDPVDAMLELDPFSAAVIRMEAEREAAHRDNPPPEPVQPDPGPVQTPNEPVHEDITPPLAVPGQLAITGRLTDADLLNALNALRSTLEMLREHADLECTVNLPPVMRL